MKLIPQLLPVDGEERHVVGGEAGHHQALPAQTEIVWRGQLGAALQRPQEVPEGCVDEERPVPGAGDDEAQLGGDDGAGDGVLVAGQDSAGGRNLREGISAPDCRCAVVFGAGGDK